MIAWASVGGKTGICSPLEVGNTYFWKKTDVCILIPINWFDSCNDSFGAGMKLTLHKSQFTVIMSCSHERNFVVKCVGTGLCETNILWNLKRKRWGTWHIISPLPEKVGGRVPHVPHLIAPMHAVMSLQFTHVSSFACKGGLRKSRADCSTAGLYCVS